MGAGKYPINNKKETQKLRLYISKYNGGFRRIFTIKYFNPPFNFLHQPQKPPLLTFLIVYDHGRKCLP